MSKINKDEAKAWINQNNPSWRLKQIIINELWDFCEKEFKADFENDYVQGYGSKTGMSDRTEIFVEHLIKVINEKTN